MSGSDGKIEKTCILVYVYHMMDVRVSLEPKEEAIAGIKAFKNEIEVTEVFSIFSSLTSS
jgi:hypothetical protein